jgi:uncharacterized ion transporter superfamily protein YfcC
MKLSKFKAPDTYFIISSLIVLTAILTWIIPGGAFQTQQVGDQNLLVPGSFHYIESHPQGFGQILMAPIRGFVDAALIIGFVLIVGGSFYILQQTEAIDAAIRTIAHAHRTSRIIQKLIIPIFMILFSFAGAVFGMSEEVIPFVLLFIPMALALGYDTVIGVAIPFIGAGAGFAAAFINPFTLGIAQGIAEVPPLSGMAYRLLCWIITTSIAILFVRFYANKVKNNPEISFTYQADQQKRMNLHLENHSEMHLSKRHQSVLLVFLAGIIILIVGVLRYKWYIEEIAALFLVTGIACGIVGKLNISEMTGAFVKGTADLIGTGLIIALARAILIIAREGQIIDTILYSLSTVVGDFHPVISSQAMFLIQTVINFFVPSGSGQAAMTMPIMAPLADLVGISRQTAVLAFQFGDGFSNMIIPTSGVTMGVLAVAKIPWEKWARWILPLEIIFILTGLLLLIPPFLFNWH